MKKLVLALPLTAVLLAAPAYGASQKEAAKAIHEAVKATLEVKELGFMWKHSFKKLIGPAKQAYKKGDYDRALSLAERALEHAERGKQQYQASREAGPRF